MPKRDGQSRGGSRGGNFARSKSLKRRANKGKSTMHAHHDAAELVDLGADAYHPAVGNTSLWKRPTRRMMSEAQHTDTHLVETMTQPLRYCRVEFVKATIVHDPGKDLTEDLKKCDVEHGLKDHLSQDMNQVNVQIEAPEYIESGEEPSSSQRSCESDKNIMHDNTGYVNSVGNVLTECVEERAGLQLDASNHPQPLILKLDKADGYIDEREREVIERIQEDTEYHIAKRGREDADCNEIAIQGNNATDIMIDIDFESDEREEEVSEELFIVDNTGDDEIFSKYSVQRKSASALLEAERSRRKVQIEFAATEHDPYFLVGKVMLKTLTDQYGDVSTELPRCRQWNKAPMTFSNFLGSYHEDEFEICKTMSDFDFDAYSGNLIEVFADPEGRGRFHYGNNDETGNRGPETMSDDYDVYVLSDISEGSEPSDVDIENLDSGEEGLEDILAFARTQHKVQTEIDLLSTQSLNKNGKGRKQILELDSHLELELRESLMEQFQYQKQSRKNHILLKNEVRLQEGVELHDLNIKYDYSLHIKEIKGEFDKFLLDVERETMRFPPLDGHGNQTIKKLAGHYNMKCIRCGGSGLSLFMKVAKTKKTFKYVPAYDQIGYIMKQRPVFKRVDAKPRSKDKIAETDGKKVRHAQANTSDIVREGDIVGGKAPEIGNNNIGRQLLERLGWIEGEGLGTLGNKGISQPLTATVKISKTGLK